MKKKKNQTGNKPNHGFFITKIIYPTVEGLNTNLLASPGANSNKHLVTTY